MTNLYSFKEYYKLPLHLYPEPYNSYAWTSESMMALMFNSRLKRRQCEKIVNIINGDSLEKIPNLERKVNEFFYDGILLFQIRGWGSLTGTGGYNLPIEKAAKIQDEFSDYIFSKLKN